MKIRTSLKPLAFAAAALLPVAAWPATATTTMAVTTTVLNSCIVVALPLAFGNYDPTSATDTAGTTTVSVTCTSGVPYDVGLDKGTNGASVTTRKMISGGNLLPYALYRDSSHTLNWGTTIGTDVSHGVSLGVLQAVTVYGLIPKNATVPSGAYTDTVNVTVTY